MVRYPANKWTSFAFTNEGGNCLVAFLKNGKVVTFTNNDFRKIDSQKIEQDKSFTFKMTSSPGINVNAEMLRTMVKL